MPSAKKPKTSTATAIADDHASGPATVPSKTTKAKTDTVAATTEPIVVAPKGKKATAAVVATTAVATTVAAQTENVVIEVESIPDTISSNFSEFITKFQKMLGEFTALKTELRSLERKTVKELKAVEKITNRRKKKAGTRAPSGFVKPTKISDELANFLGKPVGSEMARTEVTREINDYIRKHSLQDKTNGRKIIPDQQLAKLLNIQKTDELTYFNLQRYMSPHFAKSGVAIAAAAAVAATTAATAAA